MSVVYTLSYVGRYGDGQTSQSRNTAERQFKLNETSTIKKIGQEIATKENRSIVSKIY
jgi:hypothetical protein